MSSSDSNQSQEANDSSNEIDQSDEDSDQQDKDIHKGKNKKSSEPSKQDFHKAKKDHSNKHTEESEKVNIGKDMRGRGCSPKQNDIDSSPVPKKNKSLAKSKEANRSESSIESDPDCDKELIKFHPKSKMGKSSFRSDSTLDSSL